MSTTSASITMAVTRAPRSSTKPNNEIVFLPVIAQYFPLFLQFSNEREGDG